MPNWWAQSTNRCHTYPVPSNGEPRAGGSARGLLRELQSGGIQGQWRASHAQVVAIARPVAGDPGAASSTWCCSNFLNVAMIYSRCWYRDPCYHGVSWLRVYFAETTFFMLHIYEFDVAVALFWCCMIFEWMLHETTLWCCGGNRCVWCVLVLAFLTLQILILDVGKHVFSMLRQSIQWVIF